MSYISEANTIALEGPGPFLLPFVGGEITFALGDDVAVMRMVTKEGQELILPFDKETLRALGIALAGALDKAFPRGLAGAGDLAYVPWGPDRK